MPRGLAWLWCLAPCCPYVGFGAQIRDFIGKRFDMAYDAKMHGQSCWARLLECPI